MGYVPDALVSEMMARVRGQQKPTQAKATLAWINSYPEEKAWHRIPWLKGYLKGARKRASELGYGLDEIFLHDAKLIHPKGIERILKARGIRGVLVSPTFENRGVINLAWENFCGVVLDKMIQIPALDRVSPDYWSSTLLALQKLRGLGKRKIGLWLGLFQDQITQHQITAAYRTWQENLPPSLARLEPMLPDLNPRESSKLFKHWVGKSKLDAVICIDDVVWGYLQTSGFKNRVMLAHLNLYLECRIKCGIDQQHAELGAVAVDVLVSNLHGARVGVPSVPRETSVVGRWRF